MDNEPLAPFTSFPSTRWSQILSARETDSPERNRAWDALAAAYWKPVYAYIRASTGWDAEEARDRTQDVFLWMMESSLVQRADPARGRFRALLKVSIRNYLINLDRARRRLKRGGGQPRLSLDLRGEELPAIEVPDPKGRSPEEILSHAWRTEILTRAAAMLEKRYRSEDRAVYYEVFRDYFLAASEEPDYKAVAEKYGISVGDVSNYLMHAKRTYRSILAELVADTVSNTEELREELAWLLGSEGE